MSTKKNKLTMTIQFDLEDNTDSFGRFCAALINGGFEDAVKQMGQELLKEAKRRNLPIAAEIEGAVR